MMQNHNRFPVMGVAIFLAWCTLMNVPGFSPGLVDAPGARKDRADQKAREAGSEKAITREVVVGAPIAAVWKAWTTEEGITSFFAPAARVELRVDGPYELFFNPFAKPGSKGADGMRILAFQDQQMLTFTWSAPPHLPEARKQRTVVIVRFEQQGKDKTRVRLHHVGWGEGGEWDKAFRYFSDSWPRVLANLESRFSKGPIDWTDWLEDLKKRAKK